MNSKSLEAFFSFLSYSLWTCTWFSPGLQPELEVNKSKRKEKEREEKKRKKENVCLLSTSCRVLVGPGFERDLKLH